MGDDFVKNEEDVVVTGPKRQDRNWLSYVNPFNWGVDDYSKYTFEGAYERAKRAGEKEFMWGNKRYTTGWGGTDAQEMQQYGITSDQRVYNPNETRLNLGKLNTTAGYAIDPVRVASLALTGKDSKENGKIIFNDYDDRVATAEHDAFRLYLGLPQTRNSFSPSRYKKGAFEINDYKEAFPIIITQEDFDELVKIYGAPEPEDEKEKHVGGEESFIKPFGDLIMGKHTVTKGEDDKGQYFQYNDIWDLDTYKLNANEFAFKHMSPKNYQKIKDFKINNKHVGENILKAMDKNVVVGDIADKFNKPFEIEGRIYYKRIPGTNQLIRSDQYDKYTSAGGRLRTEYAPSDYDIQSDYEITPAQVGQYINEKQNKAFGGNIYDKGGSLPKFQTRGEVKCPPGPNGEPQIQLPNGQCGTLADLKMSIAAQEKAMRQGDIAQQTGIKSNERIMAEIVGAARLKQKKEQAARTRTTIGPDTRTEKEKQKAREFTEQVNKRRKDLGFMEGAGHSQEYIDKKRAEADKILKAIEVGTLLEAAISAGIKGIAKAAPRVGEYLTQGAVKNAYKFNPSTFKPIKIESNALLDADIARANQDATIFSQSPANRAKLEAFRPRQVGAVKLPDFSVTNQQARFIDDPEALKLYEAYRLKHNPSLSIEQYLGEQPGQYGARGYGDLNDVVLVNKNAPYTSNIPSTSAYTDALHETTHSRSIRLEATDAEKEIAGEAWSPMIKKNNFGMPEEEVFAVQNELRIDKLKDIKGDRVYTEKDIPEIEKGLQDMIKEGHSYLFGVNVKDFNMPALIKSLNQIGLGATTLGLGMKTAGAIEQKKQGGQLKKFLPKAFNGFELTSTTTLPPDYKDIKQLQEIVISADDLPYEERKALWIKQRMNKPWPSFYQTPSNLEWNFEDPMAPTGKPKYTPQGVEIEYVQPTEEELGKYFDEVYMYGGKDELPKYNRKEKEFQCPPDENGRLRINVDGNCVYYDELDVNVFQTNKKGAFTTDSKRMAGNFADKNKLPLVVGPSVVIPQGAEEFYKNSPYYKNVDLEKKRPESDPSRGYGMYSQTNPETGDPVEQKLNETLQYIHKNGLRATGYGDGWLIKPGQYSDWTDDRLRNAVQGITQRSAGYTSEQDWKQYAPNLQKLYNSNDFVKNFFNTSEFGNNYRNATGAGKSNAWYSPVTNFVGDIATGTLMDVAKGTRYLANKVGEPNPVYNNYGEDINSQEAMMYERSDRKQNPGLLGFQNLPVVEQAGRDLVTSGKNFYKDPSLYGAGNVFLNAANVGFQGFLSTPVGGVGSTAGIRQFAKAPGTSIINASRDILGNYSGKNLLGKGMTFAGTPVRFVHNAYWGPATAMTGFGRSGAPAFRIGDYGWQEATGTAPFEFMWDPISEKFYDPSIHRSPSTKPTTVTPTNTSTISTTGTGANTTSTETKSTPEYKPVVVPKKIEFPTAYAQGRDTSYNLNLNGKIFTIDTRTSDGKLVDDYLKSDFNLNKKNRQLYDFKNNAFVLKTNPEYQSILEQILNSSKKQ